MRRRLNRILGIPVNRMVVASTPWMCTDCDLNTTSDDEARAWYEQCVRCHPEVIAVAAPESVADL